MQLDRAPSGQQLKDENDQREDEKDVDERADRRERDDTEQPEDQQDDDDRPEHGRTSCMTVRKARATPTSGQTGI
jgi:hypothetical protein